MSTALFPHHDWADADGLDSPDPVLARTGYFHHDPDSDSDRLRTWHKGLWSKEIPGGPALELQFDGAGLRDTARDQYLKSDAAVPVWERWGEVQPFLPDTEQRLLDSGRGTVHDLGWRLYDMGGMILFPGHQVDGQWTINQAKGCTRVRIADRLDLTLECIRLYYDFLQTGGGSDRQLPAGYDRVNPLGAVLHRYGDFFELFESFERYVDFWLLDDLVSEGDAGPRVDVLLRAGSTGPYDFATERALPRDADEYLAYLIAADDFVDKRNRRMAQVAHLQGYEVCSACLTVGAGEHQRGWD